jgi:hypothetical protein
MFTRASYWTISWDSWTKCTSILISFHLFLCLPSAFFASYFPVNIPLRTPRLFHTSPTSIPSLLFHLMNTTIRNYSVPHNIFFFPSLVFCPFGSNILFSILISNTFHFRCVLQRDGCLDRGARGIVGISWTAYVTTLVKYS